MSTTTKEQRIEIVNKIINEIANTGRNFFKYDGKIAKVYQKNNRVYMLNEFNDKEMCLSTKKGVQPIDWIHGKTLWALTIEFKDFIITSNKIYNSCLYCEHLGYPESDMIRIRNLAYQLGYLAENNK